MGPTWPHHASSRFVEAHGLRWHVQAAGSGPLVLLLHGTGAIGLGGSPADPSSACVRFEVLRYGDTETQPLV